MGAGSARAIDGCRCGAAPDSRALEVLEPAMKSGQVCCSVWEEVASWIEAAAHQSADAEGRRDAGGTAAQGHRAAVHGAASAARRRNVWLWMKPFLTLFDGRKWQRLAANAQSVPRFRSNPPAPDACACRAGTCTQRTQPHGSPCCRHRCMFPNRSVPDTRAAEISVEQVIGEDGSRLGAKEIVAERGQVARCCPARCLSERRFARHQRHAAVQSRPKPSRRSCRKCLAA